MQPSHVSPGAPDRGLNLPIHPRRPKLLARLREALCPRHCKRRAPAVRLTDSEAIEQVIMPIRTRRRAKLLDRAQATEDKGISATLAAVPTACYARRRTKPRILCGAIQLLLAER